MHNDAPRCLEGEVHQVYKQHIRIFSADVESTNSWHLSEDYLFFTTSQ